MNSVTAKPPESEGTNETLSWRPAHKIPKHGALLAELLADMYANLTTTYKGAFGEDDWLPKLMDSLSTGDDGNQLIEVLSDYATGSPDALARLSEAHRSMVEEPAGTAQTIIACKVEFFYAAILGSWAYSRLIDRQIDEAWRSYGEARECLGCIAAYLGVLHGEEWVGAIGRKGAIARLRNDPRQKAKEQVRQCWELWQADTSRYAGKAKFAQDMLKKFEDLTSQPVIERWCRKWEKES